MINLDQKGFLNWVLFLVLAVGIIVGTYLVSQRTNIFPQASEIAEKRLTAPYLALQPAKINAGIGCNFAVKIEIDTGGYKTDGTDAVLIFDPSKLQVSSIDKGNTYTSFPGNLIDNQKGKISISGLANLNAPFSGKGILATVNFTTTVSAGNGPTIVKFDFDPNNKSKTNDSNIVQNALVKDVLNEVGEGKIIISSKPCTAVTVYNSRLDLNRDGKVDSKDVDFLCNYMGLICEYKKLN